MRKSKDLCIGCRNNIYNNPNSNPGKVKQCWGYKTAKVKKELQLVHIRIHHIADQIVSQ